MAYENLDLSNKKFFVEVSQPDRSNLQFTNCTYIYLPDRNELNVTTSDGRKLKFLGNFYACIMSMEDKKRPIHD